MQYRKIYYWDSWSSTNNTNKRHKTVDKLQPYNTSGYGVYHVWACSVVSKETNQTNNSQTTPPANPPTAPPTVPPAGNPPGTVPAAVTEGWIPASNLPEGAKVTAGKWIYDLTQTFESTDPNLSGWTQIGSEWRQIGTESIEYAVFPDGFDKNHSLYKQYNNTLYSPYEDGSVKWEVNNTRVAYIYWHWTYEPGLPGSPVNNRYIQEYKGYDSVTGYNYDLYRLCEILQIYKNSKDRVKYLPKRRRHKQYTGMGTV